MDIKQEWLNYVNGEFIIGSDGWLTVDKPSDGQPLAKQALADKADVDRAVSAAKACHEKGDLWCVRPCDRARKLRKMGDYFDKNREDIALLLSLEAGKPLWESRIEIDATARYFEYYGCLAEHIEGKSIPLGDGSFDFTVLEPYGVSAQIIPWNFPLDVGARSLAAALAAGNACVLKTPELDPLAIGYHFACAAEYADMPKGAVNVLCGHGATAGAALAESPNINHIVFTGSVKTGVSVATAAAQNVIPAVLELGGKSAAIVRADADLDSFIDNVRWGIYFNAGQVCSAMSRVLIDKSIYGEVIDRMTDLAKSLRMDCGHKMSEDGVGMGATELSNCAKMPNERGQRR